MALAATVYMAHMGAGGMRAVAYNDAVQVIVLKDLYELLEKVIDRFEDVSNGISDIWRAQYSPSRRTAGSAPCAASPSKIDQS